MQEEIEKAVKAIRDGYPYFINYYDDYMYFLVVENPQFKEDDGSNPNLCLPIKDIKSEEEDNIFLNSPPVGKEEL